MYMIIECIVLNKNLGFLYNNYFQDRELIDYG